MASRQQGINWLKSEIPPSRRVKVVWLHSWNPDGWWLDYEVNTAPQLMQRMRDAGFDETVMQVADLDASWMDLVEEASGVVVVP